MMGTTQGHLPFLPRLPPHQLLILLTTTGMLEERDFEGRRAKEGRRVSAGEINQGGNKVDVCVWLNAHSSDKLNGM